MHGGVLGGFYFLVDYVSCRKKRHTMKTAFSLELKWDLKNGLLDTDLSTSQKD